MADVALHAAVLGKEWMMLWLHATDPPNVEVLVNLAPLAYAGQVAVTSVAPGARYDWVDNGGGAWTFRWWPDDTEPLQRYRLELWQAGREPRTAMWRLTSEDTGEPQDQGLLVWHLPHLGTARASWDVAYAPAWVVPGDPITLSHLPRLASEAAAAAADACPGQ